MCMPVNVYFILLKSKYVEVMGSQYLYRDLLSGFNIRNESLSRTFYVRIGEPTSVSLVGIGDIAFQKIYLMVTLQISLHIILDTDQHDLNT